MILAGVTVCVCVRACVRVCVCVRTQMIPAGVTTDEFMGITFRCSCLFDGSPPPPPPQKKKKKKKHTHTHTHNNSKKKNTGKHRALQPRDPPPPTHTHTHTPRPPSPPQAHSLKIQGQNVHLIIYLFIFCCPSSVSTSEALLPRRTSRHPYLRPHSFRIAAPPFEVHRRRRQIVAGPHPKNTLHGYTTLHFGGASDTCSDSIYVGQQLLCPLLTTMLAS